MLFVMNMSERFLGFPLTFFLKKVDVDISKNLKMLGRVTSVYKTGKVVDNSTCLIL